MREEGGIARHRSYPRISPLYTLLHSVDERIHALVGYARHGKTDLIQDLRCQSCSRKINTAFIERLNLTLRQGVSFLTRHLGASFNLTT